MKQTVENNKEGARSKKKTATRVLGICGFCALCALLLALVVNSLLCVFLPHYYPTFGGYRLFAIVSDSMEPEIPTGYMISGRVPKSADEIEVGTIITFEVRQGNSVVLVTHRVKEIHTDAATGVISYTTQGDNVDRADGVRPTYDRVVGIYTGGKCAFFGYFFGFLQSSEGAITLIIIALIIALTLIIIRFVNLVTVWRSTAVNALKKSGSMLSGTEIEQLGTIADVIGIVSKEPIDEKDVKRKDKKLKWFIRTGSLPKRPYSDDLDENTLSNEVVTIPKLVPVEEQTEGQEKKEES